jgi:hypothetical protein
MSTYITKNLPNINFTTRDVIGYSFEVLISKLLGRYGIGYNSNPLGNITEWKKHQGKGVDFKIPELKIELEAKSGYAKIFRSWILRDWITRFSYHNETRVVIVKPSLKLSDQCLDLLFYYNINIIYPDSISYLIGRGNKPLEVDSIKKYLELGEGNKKYDSESKCPQGLEPVSSKSSATFRDKFRTELAKIGRLLIEASSTKNSSAQNNGTKNTSKNTSAEKNGIENDGARTEEKTESSTSREYIVPPSGEGTEMRRLEFKEISFESKEISLSLGKISTVSVKIRAFYNKLKTSILNLLSGIEMLFSKIWNDKHGEVTLANWIPVKLKVKKKTRTRSQKMISCPFRVVVVCSHYPQFYLCSLLVVYDCVQKLLGLGYDEDKIYRYLKNCLFKGMWQYKNTHLIKCRCKPISFIDNEIVDRRFRTTLSIFEPCKKYKCSTMIGKRMCPYLMAIEKTSIKPKQLNLSVFMNGDECNEEEARS